MLLSLDEMNTLLRYIDKGERRRPLVPRGAASGRALDVPTASERSARRSATSSWSGRRSRASGSSASGPVRQGRRDVITIPELKARPARARDPSGASARCSRTRRTRCASFRLEYAQRCEDAKRAAFHGLECEECGAAEVLRQLEARVYDRGAEDRDALRRGRRRATAASSADQDTSLLHRPDGAVQSTCARRGTSASARSRRPRRGGREGERARGLRQARGRGGRERRGEVLTRVARHEGAPRCA